MILSTPTPTTHTERHGRGRAWSNATFTYGLYLFSVSPPAGSVAGGTTLTLTGSGFATTHTFYAGESASSMGSSLASYRVTFGASTPGGADGTECVVFAATSTTLKCVTEPASAATILSAHRLRMKLCRL